ncbi:transposase [Xanthomonas oryzae]|uniref:transposase n=1 Tax=Xanthomonas oryzae TaxID=347 RepID=UPI00094A10B6|nr:transposase [Xanthomonas oryzae pv. oryzae]
MQGFICVFGVLELPVFVTLRPGFWQFSPMRTRRPAAEQLPADELFRSRLENQIDVRHPLVQLRRSPALSSARV